MKLRFLCVAGGNEEFFKNSCELYKKKMNHFLPFEIEVLRPKGLGRAQAAEKKQKESEVLLKRLQEKEFVVLFDEKGKSFNSLQFSNKITEVLSSSQTQMTFVIGGAYGSSDDLKRRANLKVCLSEMTMNHLVASVMGLEQIYRALTIWKGIPYHNE